ncbi:MAG: hypothetical protein KatS3mg059_0930 [Thermomicrobiales bacterium]|nr:MAG: hypothetical protein KatS3mg059_0930 [Thermomicrobiales bacterium]
MSVTIVADRLAESVRQVRSELAAAPEPPLVTFATDTRLVENYVTTAQIRDFRLTVDEPERLGGSDLGPTPVELVLGALGTCQEIVYATYARVLGIPLDGVSVRVEGVLDPRGFFGVADVPAGLREVTFTVEIQSPAPADAVQRLIATVNAHCPVLDILRQPVPVAGVYTLNHEQIEPASEPVPVVPGA